MKTVRAVSCGGPQASWQGARAASDEPRRAIRRIAVALIVALALVLVALMAAEPPETDRNGAAAELSGSTIDAPSSEQWVPR